MNVGGEDGDVKDLELLVDGLVPLVEGGIQG
jgi:hypothetical protein